MSDVDQAVSTAKMAALRAWFRAQGSALVCFSGGVDSAFVLAVAHAELAPRAVGMPTAVSASLAPGELDDARRTAQAIGADHRVVESSEVDDPAYVANAPDRCFHCKSELYRIAARARRLGPRRRRQRDQRGRPRRLPSRPRGRAGRRRAEPHGRARLHEGGRARRRPRDRPRRVGQARRKRACRAASPMARA